MFSDPQFWVAVAFFAFIAAVFNPVRKMLTTSLDSKIKQIKDSIDEAENLKNETQITLSEIKKRQNDVQHEIQSITEEAKNKANQLKINAEIKLKDQIEKRKIIATTKIDQLTRDANNQIQLHISSTAIEAMVNLLKEKLDEKEKQKIIDSSINELSSVLKN